MIRAFALAVVVASAACGGGHEDRVHRSGSAAPVVLVAEPVYADGGTTSGRVIGEEVEPNDSDDVATPLALGAQIRGKLEPGDSDVDRFRIDIVRPGELAVFVADLDGEAVLEIEDPAGTVIARSARGARAREGVPNLGVSVGRYVAVVRGKPRGKPAHAPPHRPRGTPEPPPPPVPAVAYRISADLVSPESNAEREPDDDRATATDLLVGDRATGYVGWEHDVDVWKLSVQGISSEVGKTALDIDVGKLDGVALELEVSDAVGQPIATRKVRAGAPAQIHGLVPVVPAGGSPFHYLAIRGSTSNPDATYEVSVRAVTLEADTEVEPDDTPEHPFEVPSSATAVAASWTPGDVDCFLIATSPAPHSVDVAVEPAKGLELVLDVMADGKVVGGPARARGLADHLVAKVPGGARTIVRVRGDQNAVAGGVYKLRLLGSTP